MLLYNLNCSGFHGHWNARVAVKHPSLWTFIRHLKDSQTVTEVAIDNARAGRSPPLQRKKWRRRNLQLKKLRQRYLNGRISLSRYWASVSHVVGTKY